MKKLTSKQKGFTLIELLIAISLLAITAGLSSDIILSLVRTYNKTRITNEIEQSGNLALAKMEKELRVATELINPTVATCDSSLVFEKERLSDASIVTVTYDILSDGTLRRTEDDGSTTTSAPILDSTQVNGIMLDTSLSEICVLNQTQPHVVVIDFTLLQASGTGGVSFEGSVQLDQTIVLRGTY